jgi:large subunit ribosomal protein L18
MASRRTQKQRRRTGKTDYKLRLNLLKSNKPRIVIRRTNNYFIIQTVESQESQDKVTKTLTSKELLKNGWDAKAKGSLKSLPASYLIGKLFAKDLGKTEYIMDLGMARTIAGNRLFALLKGLVDGGANINVNEKMFPSEERIKGEHLKDEVKTMISKVAEKIK